MSECFCHQRPSRLQIMIVTSTLSESTDLLHRPLVTDCVLLLSAYFNGFYSRYMYICLHTCTSWYTCYLLQLLRKFECDILHCEYPALSKDGADKTIREPVSFAELQVTLTATCDSNWKIVVDQQSVSIHL